ncbi:hypothetical protein TrVGV298_008162 [Trichoderma virens]|nr:hypothetical protein TrVGV298_008162 [Trichoderma virens]
MEDFYKALRLDDTITSSIRESIGTGLPLPSALRATLSSELSSSPASSPIPKRLQFVIDIIDICKDDRELYLPILQDKSLSTLNDVALKYYSPPDDSDAATQQISKAVRPELLYRTPIAVLSALCNSGILIIQPPAANTTLRKLLALHANTNNSGNTTHSTFNQFTSTSAYKSNLSSLATGDATAVQKTLASLLRLHALVTDAEDLPALLDAGFTSARSIALTSQSDFTSRLSSSALSNTKLAAIHREAQRIDTRNDAIWADIVRSRREIPVLAVTGIKSGKDYPETDDVQVNLDTLFRDLDSVTADESTSVLGPASYLVDLMQLLRSASIGTCEKGWEVKDAKTMLDIFLHRRPDVAEIQLSKVEVGTAVTYQEMVVEVMENYLEKELGTDGDLVHRAFPSLPTSKKGDYLAAAHATHERRLAAEALSLQPLDFEAITQEGIYTRDFVTFLQQQHSDLASKTYDQVVGLSLAGEYWGYEADNQKVAASSPDDGSKSGTPTWKMINPASTMSLRLIKAQLLPRSDLTPLELNMILKTRYLSNRLVVTLEKTVTETVDDKPVTEQKFSDELEDMRLQESPMIGRSDEAARISRRTSLDLQSFIRLRNILGWSIETTDAAIAALAHREVIYPSDTTQHHVLDGDFIRRLAAAQQLSIKTSIPVVELFPFWGLMYAQFPNSLYARLFLRSGLVKLYPSLALVDGDGQTDATFGKNMGAVLRALGMTQDEQVVFMGIIGFDSNTVWTLDGIARLYSHQRLCKILRLPVKRYADWWRVVCKKGGVDPFIDPQSALKVLDLWLDLPEGIESSQQALDLIISLEEEEGGKLDEHDLSAVAGIVGGVAAVEREFALVLSGGGGGAGDVQVYSSESLLAMCSKILNPSVAKDVVDVVEGTASITTTSNSIAISVFAQTFRLNVSDVITAFKEPVTGSKPDEREQEIAARRKQAMVWMVPELKRRATDALVSDSLATRFHDAPSQLIQQLLAARDPTPLPGVPDPTNATYLQSLKGFYASIKDYCSGATSTYFFPPVTAEYTFITDSDKGKAAINGQDCHFTPIPGPDVKRLTTPQHLRQGDVVLVEWTDGLQLEHLSYSTSIGEYLERLSGGSKTDTIDKLVAETKRLTSLDASDISAFFTTRWPTATVKDLAKTFLDGDLYPLQQLTEACSLSKDLEELKTALSSSSASSTSGGALARAKEVVLTRQQRVLQEYIIRLPVFVNRGIINIDDLSADFLMDLQMGPPMETSRIGQAIASAQFFIQRSLLGLEKVYGVSTTGVDQSLWAWMCKFTLWQANRKVFLYPENWVDPSLRDDKTHAFEELESKMLQASLDRDTISQLLRDYVYAIHEVADLEVLSYLWESTKDYRGRYHFFGRSRAAPFVFYYRQLVVTGTNTMLMSWNWLPWSKMEVDIQTHEVDADQKPLAHPGSYLLPALFKNRLFLFIPQIARQAKKGKDQTKSLADQAKDVNGPSKAEEFWEIKMAWVEMRNGKWSPKYITATGIHVGVASGESALPSISSFRFRLETTNGGLSLAIHVDRWKVSGSGGVFQILGRFEMQGLRLRLIDGIAGSTVGTYIDTEMEFGRITHSSSTNSISTLKTQVEAYKLGIDANQYSLLAVPSPKTMTETYALSWLLTNNVSQYPGVLGLVVERTTPTQASLFFGSPRMTLEGKIDTSNKTTISTSTMTHDSALYLVEEIADTEGYHAIFDALEHLPKDMENRSFGFQNRKYRELAMPASIYNWEMGFHVVSLLMERLLATQQFDLAIEISRLVFDPSRDDAKPDNAAAIAAVTPQPLSNLDRSWRFAPFKSADLRLGGSVRQIIQNLKPLPAESLEVQDWKANPFSPHAVARKRPAVYMKRFVMKCIEILIASGDQYFRQPSLEAIPMATQRYTEALTLFGPAPATIVSPTRPVTKRYDDIKSLVTDFATATVDMELEFPHFINTLVRGNAPPAETRDGTLGFVRSPYFGIPANPAIQALRDIIDGRLYNIRHGLDIDGNPRRLPLFDPPLDPGQLIAARAGGASLASLAGGRTEGPMPNCRARFLLQKAQDLCAELRSLSESYLSIKERRDAEAMARLRARQETGVLSLLNDVRQHQVLEATSALETLAETRKSHILRLTYFLALIGESADIVPSSDADWVDLDFGIRQPNNDELRMSAEEYLESTSMESAVYTNKIATGIEQNAGLLMALPSLTIQAEPMGIGISTQMDASIIAKALLVGAGVIRAAAQASTDMASRAARKGQLVRQLQERRMQANLAGHDIKIVDKQVENQQKRVDVAKAELRAQKQQAVDAAEMEEFLRTKYSSDKLYSWLEAETRKLAYQSYLAALDMARTAERALQWEYGPRAQPSFLSSAYWDESRDGLLAAQELSAALHRVDKFQMQGTPHDYELTKTISLRQVAPLALLNLRTTRTAEFEIPEVLLDLDFPGHYCRRIQSVAVSIPSIVGPYTGVNCSLRLLEHRYRLKAGVSPSTGSYYNQDIAGDERFHTDSVPITSVALSSCTHDTGIFELNFGGERYAPFEGAGVISRWKLELPSPFRQFDYNSIGDVLFTVKFTSLEGGATWKNQATQAARDFRSQIDESLGNEGGFSVC